MTWPNVDVMGDCGDGQAADGKAGLKLPAVSGIRVDRKMWTRYSIALCILIIFPISLGAAQQANGVPPQPGQEGHPNIEKAQSKTERLERLPIEWLIGPYIPVQESLHPLSTKEREQIYVRQTFLTAGSYAARMFSAGLDQVRGSPYQWGGGMAGYGRRYAARYGEFVVQNTFVAAGNAALGYEPRYDFCRCSGFWRRTQHAVSRGFMAYDRTEQKLRFQVPTYAGAFGAGVLYSSWQPQRHNVWKGGAYSVLSQAGIGSAYDVVSEFSLDILHKFGIKKHLNPRGDESP
jgi:hypothetical protein